jgi:hypothetical protein
MVVGDPYLIALRQSCPSLGRNHANLRLMLEQRGSPSQPARRERRLGLQTYAPKKALQSRIRTQAVKRKVGL